MTDRVHSLTVVLEHDYRDDDVEVIVSAIHQIRGVLRVDTHVTEISDHMAESRAIEHWRRKLVDLLWPTLAEATKRREG
jgi:hypothetical protein